MRFIQAKGTSPLQMSRTEDDQDLAIAFPEISPTSLMGVATTSDVRGAVTTASFDNLGLGQ